MLLLWFIIVLVCYLNVEKTCLRESATSKTKKSEARSSLQIMDIGSIVIMLSRQRTTKADSRLCSIIRIYVANQMFVGFFEISLVVTLLGKSVHLAAHTFSVWKQLPDDSVIPHLILCLKAITSCLSLFSIWCCGWDMDFDCSSFWILSFHVYVNWFHSPSILRLFFFFFIETIFQICIMLATLMHRLRISIC